MRQRLGQKPRANRVAGELGELDRDAESAGKPSRALIALWCGKPAVKKGGSSLCEACQRSVSRVTFV